MVIPFPRSRSIESMTRSLTSWLARKAPDCQSILSTRVVFPWSTWATIATLRRSERSSTSFLLPKRGAGQPTVRGTRIRDLGRVVFAFCVQLASRSRAARGGPLEGDDMTTQQVTSSEADILGNHAVAETLAPGAVPSQGATGQAAGGD